MTIRLLSSLLWLLLIPSLLGCEAGEAPATVTTTPNGSRLELPSGVEPIDFPTGTVRIHGNDQVHTLRVEIAETDEQRERGLMYRTSMPEEAGMLFTYPMDTEGGFWMYNTRIPLSIAYIRSDGTILQIVQMEPCPSEFATMCPSYPARLPYRYALEVNQGYYEQRGIQPGAHITWERN
jgi:uncharacterized protein